MTRIGRFTVAADHPSLPGHFPGRPIVPGVVLLDEALALIQAHVPGLAVGGVVSAKFVAAVRPGQDVEVACGPPRDGRLAFTCLTDNEAVLRGVLALRPPSAPLPA